MTQLWHDRERNLLVYDLPEPHKVTSVIPSAVSLSNGYVAVPKTLHNLQLLRWLDLPVVPPLDEAYDWPRNEKVYPYPFRAQIITANFLAVHPRALVLSEMRTGKTQALLWAADYVMQQYPPGECRAIVAAPLTILQRVWGDAIFNHLLGRRTFIILHGDAEKRRQLLATPADFYIINHDGLKVGVSAGKRRSLEFRGLAADLQARTDIKIAIVDEAGAFRHHTTKRSKALRASLGTRPYFWSATGTPTPHGPTDAYGIALPVNNCFGESFTNYRARVMFRISQFKWIPAKGSHIQARNLLTPSIRFEMKDCIDVPAKLPPQLLEVGFTPAQLKAYKEMKRAAIMTMEKGGTITAANEAALRSKLIQIACGAIYENTGTTRIVHRIDAGSRIEATRELAEEAGDKIIILAPLTSVLHLLHEKLEGFSREIVNGEVAPKVRDDIFRRFQQEEHPQILLADPGTLSHGLDLSVSKVILWYALPDKTEQYLQANERIRGPKQKYPTLVAQIVSTAIEREIYRRLEANEGLQGVMLDLVREESRVH